MSHKINDIWNETQMENGREDLCLPTYRPYARGWKEQKERDEAEDAASVVNYELNAMDFINKQFGL
jgi:hypothetical protein